MLKTTYLLLFAFLICNYCEAQTDPRLKQRLDSMLQVTEDKDLEKILDFTYPKLFEIATREQLTQAMRDAFETEEFSTTLDSVKLKTIFPVFIIKDGEYAKIKHTMLMRMKFKMSLDSDNSNSMVTIMEETFGKGNVRLDKEQNSIVIFINSVMVAVKDEFSPVWSFVNYNEKDPISDLIFSKEVIEKLKEYN